MTGDRMIVELIEMRRLAEHRTLDGQRALGRVAPHALQLEHLGQHHRDVDAHTHLSVARNLRPDDRDHARHHPPDMRVISRVARPQPHPCAIEFEKGRVLPFRGQEALVIVEGDRVGRHASVQEYPRQRRSIRWNTVANVAGEGGVNRRGAGGVIVLHSALPCRGRPWQHYAANGDPYAVRAPLGSAL
jgi:hypothetical protein